MKNPSKNKMPLGQFLFFLYNRAVQKLRSQSDSVFRTAHSARFIYTKYRQKTFTMQGKTKHKEKNEQPLEMLPIIGAEEIPVKNRPILFRLTRRFLLFLVAMLSVNVLFFIVGNYQNFLFSDLKLLLFLITCNSIAIVFIGFFLILECIFYSIIQRKLFFIIALVVVTVLCLIAGLLGIFSEVISILSNGYKF